MKPEDSIESPNVSENKNPSKVSKTVIVGIIIIVIIGGGLVYSLISNNVSGKKSNKTVDVDPQQYLINELLISSSFSGFPDYAYTSDKTHAGYLVATKIPDVLEKIPCYCSCGAIGHKSLSDCFITANEGFADHASYCDLCVEEALDVYSMQKDGLSLVEIRSKIDEKYSKYGEPTDTPIIEVQKDGDAILISNPLWLNETESVECLQTKIEEEIIEEKQQISTEDTDVELIGNVNFITSLESGYKKAKLEDTHVFIYFRSEFCGWCRKFDEEVLTDETVVSLIDDSYVPISIDIYRQKEVARDFNVRGTPTFVFLDEELSEIRRIPGYVDAETFVTILNNRAQ